MAQVWQQRLVRSVHHQKDVILRPLALQPACGGDLQHAPSQYQSQLDTISVAQDTLFAVDFGQRHGRLGQCGFWSTEEVVVMPTLVGD